MKRTYVTPQMVGEKFEANEYVAVCWAIACVGGTEEGRNYPEKIYGESNWGRKEFGKGCHDHSGSCRNGNLNRIIDSSNISVMQENNSEQGWINGGIDKYVDNNGNGVLDAGDFVYWHTTSSDGTRRWNHAGEAYSVDSSRPNHS